MNAVIAAATSTNSPAPVNPLHDKEKIEFNTEGKRINERTLSTRILLPLRRIESVANFLDRPMFPKSKVPGSMPITRFR